MKESKVPHQWRVITGMLLVVGALMSAWMLSPGDTAENGIIMVDADAGPVHTPHGVVDILGAFSVDRVSETAVSPEHGKYYVVDLTMLNMTGETVNINHVVRPEVFELEAAGDIHMMTAMYYYPSGYPVRYGSALDNGVKLSDAVRMDIRMIFDVNDAVVADKDKILRFKTEPAPSVDVPVEVRLSGFEK